MLIQNDRLMWKLVNKYGDVRNRVNWGDVALPYISSLWW